MDMLGLRECFLHNKEPACVKRLVEAASLEGFARQARQRRAAVGQRNGEQKFLMRGAKRQTRNFSQR